MLAKTINKMRRPILLLVTLVSWSLAGMAQEQGQYDKGTPPQHRAGVSSFGSYTSADFGTVNQSNGALNLKFSLGTVGGRGFSLPLTLNWNSKIWSGSKDIDTDQDGTVKSVAFADYAKLDDYVDIFERISPGWTVGVAPMLFNRIVRINQITSGPNIGCYTHTLPKLTLMLPDKGEIEFRDDAFDGAPLPSDCGGYIAQSRGRRWHATDGSGMIYISDSDNAAAQLFGDLTGVVITADGTRYHFTGNRCDSITDRNGNKITIAYNNGVEITDQLGRITRIQQAVADPENPTVALALLVTMPGYNGANRYYKIKSAVMNLHYRSDINPSLPVITGSYDPLSHGYSGWWGSPTTLFPLSYGLYAQRIDNRIVLTELVLPDNRSLRFKYNQFGEVAEVQMPTGGKVWYDYGDEATIPAGQSPVWETAGDLHTTVSVDRVLIQRRTFPDGVTLEGTWNYNYTGSSSIVTAVSSTGTLILDQRHYFLAAGRYYDYPPSTSGAHDGTQNTLWSTGVEYRSETRNAAGTIITATEQDWTQRVPLSWSSYPQEQLANDNRVNQTRRYLDTGGFAKTETYYDNVNYPRANNVSEVREYDFDGTFKRRATTNYVTGSYQDDDAILLVSLPSTQTIYSTIDNSGKTAETIYAYDNYTDEGPTGNNAPLTNYATVTQHDSAYGTGKVTRGNVTSIGRWVSTAGVYLYSYSRYDILGNVVSARAPNDVGSNRVTTISFSDDFGNGSNPGGGSQGTNGPTYALPTLITSPPPQPGQPQHTVRSQYDFSTGLLTGFKDRNNIVTQTIYNDPFDRPTVIKSALGVSGVETHVAMYYAPTTAFGVTLTNNDVLTAKDQTTMDDAVLRSWTKTDGFGRTVEAWSEDPQGDVKVHTIYDSLGRAKQVSNPYRPSFETPVYTMTAYDFAGRVISVTTPDNAVVTTAYDGDRVLVADQAGKKRISKTDALGRLRDVWEVTAADQYTEDVSFPNWPSVTKGYKTTYQYDTLDNLITASQGLQTRTFAYDSLKRLLSANNPESGMICYGTVVNNQCQADGYDANGNLIYKTDARGVRTSFGYDALNRVINRSYQNDPTNTPAVSYVYDAATNGKGRLMSVSSSVSSYSYSDYDAIGRVTGASQSIGAQTYTITNVAYDLAGHLKTMTYPSGRTITNTFDGAGRLSSFTGNLGDGGAPRTYANGFSYSPFGGLQEERFETQTPIYHKQRYNPRGQLWDMRASTISFATDPANGDRGAIVNYYSNNFVQGSSGADNNGNLLRQESYIPGSVYFQDNFTYDALNRLSSIAETLNGTGNDTFSQTYSYDRWGNRTISGASGGVNNLQIWIDPSNNRLYALSDQNISDPEQRLIRYDVAGNQKYDAYTGQGSRTYDAENRMITGVGSPSATYSYDGDGRRVKRLVGPTETWQVYGLGGELLAEYTSNGTQLSKEYGYRNGELLIIATATSGWGAPPTLADNPLVVNQTLVKAQHITELRSAINSLRSHLSMSAYSWQYSATTSDYINANPILEMRTALDQALGAPPGGYAPGLAQGQPVKAIHIQELRDRVLAAWQSGGGVDIRWLVNDHLGTPRLIFDQSGSLTVTDQNGNYISGMTRHDYLPFGEELYAGTGGRTTGQGYSQPDNIRQKFAGTERDNESDLDFMQARYYSSRQGRFTSVDPENAGAYAGNPQTWNGYSYGLNNPVLYTDPDGLKVRICGTDGQCTDNKTDLSDEDFDRWFRGDKSIKLKDGKVYKNGEFIGTYERLSCDSCMFDIYELGRRIVRADAPKNAVKLYGRAALAGMTLPATGPGWLFIGVFTVLVPPPGEGGDAVAASIEADRQAAVREAWRLEAERVRTTGRGFQNWTPDELRQLRDTGRVAGYHGHHIHDVHTNPQMARDPNNIRFVKGREAHFNVHGRNWRNSTKGPTIPRR